MGAGIVATVTAEGFRIRASRGGIGPVEAAAESLRLAAEALRRPAATPAALRAGSNAASNHLDDAATRLARAAAVADRR